MLWGDETVADVQNMLQKVGAFDQGILAAATSRTDVTRVGQKLKIAVFNNQEHATVIEWGRTPGSHPPLLPLVGWAGRKGIITSLPRNISFDGEWKKKWAASGAIFRAIKAGKKSGGKSGKQKPMDPQVRDLLIVRFIADKIFRKGSKGRHPFTIVFDKRVRTFRRDIAATVRLMK